ncbi:MULTISPECIES: hypothetical protein [Nocardioides]|nr:MULTISPECIES: hypothetical protein [unclassified Nocardioides]
MTTCADQEVRYWLTDAGWAAAREADAAIARGELAPIHVNSEEE